MAIIAYRKSDGLLGDREYLCRKEFLLSIPLVMTPEDYSHRISALIRLSRLRPALFATRIAGEALPPLLGAAFVLISLYFGRVLAALVLTLAAGEIIALLLPNPTFISGLAIALALLLLGLLLYALTRLRMVNDRILRRLRTYPVPPGGLLLDDEESPKLYTLAEETIESLGAHDIAGIIITDDLDLAVVDVRVRRVVWWRVSYLMIGLPLLMTLTPEQFHALLAQRLALRGGTYAALIRLQLLAVGSWMRIQQEFQRRKAITTKLVARIAIKVSNHLSPGNAALIIMNTLAADERAAALNGSRALGEALTGIEKYRAFLRQEFWPSIQKENGKQPEPPETIYTRMAHGFGTIDREMAKIWVTEAGLQRGLSSDGTPPLSDRLALLREPCLPPAPVTALAAGEYLDEGNREALIDRLNREWRENAGPAWNARHDQTNELRIELAELRERLRNEENPGVGDRLRLAYLIEELEGEDEAIDEYRKVLALDPDNTLATFALGRLLLWNNDLQGLAMIDTAIGRDENNYLIPGVEVACSLLARQHRSHEAREFYERHQDRYHTLKVMHSEKNALAIEERSKFRFTDLYMEHRMSERDLERVQRVLARFPQIEEAYMVRKQVEHYDEIPCYVLGLVCGFDGDSNVARQERGYLVQQLYEQLGFLGKTAIILLEDQPNARMWKVMESIEGSLVYLREQGDAS